LFRSIPRPIKCRLWHDAGRVLPGPHHHLHHAAAEHRQPLGEEDAMTVMAHTQARSRHVTPVRLGRIVGKVAIYALLIFWAFVSLFPIYWTFSTSFKKAANVMKGHLIPWIDYVPDWLGWRSLGLSPDTLFNTSTVRDEFLNRFENSVIASLSASTLAGVIGACAAFGLSRFEYKFG